MNLNNNMKAIGIQSQQPVILVTGSARRIGAEIIRQAHQQGYNVIIHYQNSYQQANALCSSLNKLRINSARTIQADLSVVNNEIKLNIFIEEVISLFGRIDALVNNASKFYPTLLTESIQQLNQDWDELFLTNAKASLLLSHAFLPYLKLNNGSIINILDIHANGKPFKKHTIYNMAKSAAYMMVQSLALELAPDIRVNGVAPGTNIFPDSGSSGEIDQLTQDSIIESIPLSRIGQPEDIADAVIFLLKATYITGQVISVDGGRSLTLAGG